GDHRPARRPRGSEPPRDRHLADELPRLRPADRAFAPVAPHRTRPRPRRRHADRPLPPEPQERAGAGPLPEPGLRAGERSGCGGGRRHVLDPAAARPGPGAAANLRTGDRAMSTTEIYRELETIFRDVFD